MSSLLLSYSRARIAAALVAAASFAHFSPAQTNEYFDPSADSNVYAMVLQPDGKVIIGGAFSSLQPRRVGPAVTRNRIARLNPDGSIDPSFAPSLDGDVSTLALQSDGKIIVGGKFTHVEGTGEAAAERNGLARLLPDGRLDTTFDPRPTGTNYFPNAIVRAIAVQPDGKILVGGAFSALQPNGAGAAITRNRIARLNSDGTVDATFDPNANNVVLAIAVQADGKILLGGGFTRLQPNGAAAPVDRLRLARLNSNGTLDNTFDPRADNRVLAFALQPDGAILVGGEFTSLQPAGAPAATTRSFLVRLKADSTIDTSFDPAPNAAVQAIAVQADGRIVFGGRFSLIRPGGTSSPSARTNVARVNFDGSADGFFAPNPNQNITAIALQPDASILLAGYFTRFTGGGTTAVIRQRIARVQSDGTIETAFNPDVAGQVSALLSEPNGQVVAAGSFSSLGGVTRNSIARLNAQGVLDAAFAPDLTGQVTAAARQSDGKIVVSGNFNRVGEVTRNYIARFNADGTLDTGFDPNLNFNASALAIQSDGKIILGGSFTTVQPNGATESTSRPFLLRLNSDGTLDSAFDPQPNQAIRAIAVQSDSKILIGGDFTTLEPNSRNLSARSYIARLNGDGTLDSDFRPAVDSTVLAITLQSDGKILLGGNFTAIQGSGALGGDTRTGVARLNADGTLDAFAPNVNSPVNAVVALADGSVLVGGSFTALQPNGASSSTVRTFFAWLNPDGNVNADRGFQTNGPVLAILPQTDGGVVIAGVFTRVFSASGGAEVEADNHIARFTPNQTLDTGFVVRGGAGLGGSIGAIAVQSNSRIVLGGSFASFAGSDNTNLTRVFADGVNDPTFATTADGPVHSVLVLPESETAGLESGPVAWLTSTGLFREEFDRTAATNLAGAVIAVALQSNGQLLAGGSFSNPTGATGGNLVRFNSDGTLDTSFNPAPDGGVNAILVLSDGRIVVGGNFTNIAGQPRKYIARLNSDGTLDTSFDPNPNGLVRSIKSVTGGKILVGGTFGTLQPNGAATATNRAYLVRLNTDGTIDTAFAPTLNDSVFTILVLSDDKILLGGDFTSISSTTRNRLAKLNADGTVDTSFDPNVNGTVIEIAQQSDGKIVVGGAFSTLQPNGATSATTRFFVARVNADGTLDADFNPTLDNEVDSVAVQPDGAILLGGRFTAVLPVGTNESELRLHLVRLHSDGSLDRGFNPIADNAVHEILVTADGSMIVAGEFESFRPGAAMLVGGSFTEIGDSEAINLARLNLDGSADIYFRPDPNGAVYAIAALSDGGALIGGDFTTFAGESRTHLARLDVDGALVAAFAPAVDGAVFAIAPLSDGDSIIGGAFANVGGAAHQNLARLNTDGSIDAAFAASTNGRVSSLVLQPDGKVLVSGEFTTVNGVAQARLARLNANGSLDAAFDPVIDGAVWAIALEADGRMFIGGAFTHVDNTARARLARLNADGSLDSAVTADADDDVLALALTPGGRVLVGGEFGTLDGGAHRLVGRIGNPTLAGLSASVSSDLTQVSLHARGGSPEFDSVLFAVSTDADTWTPLGSGTRTGSAGVWQITGATLPASGPYFIRTRATITTTRYDSTSRYEMQWQFVGNTPAGWSNGGPIPTLAVNPGGSNGNGGTGGGTGGNSSGDPDATNAHGDLLGGDAQALNGGITAGEPASVRVFFGSFASNAGEFALLLRADRSAVFLAALGNTQASIEASSFTVAANGSFSFEGVATLGTISGTITGDYVAGVASVGGLVFTGNEDAAGATAALAGLYDGAIIGSADGQVLVLAGREGSAFVVAGENQTFSAVVASLAANGALTATLPDGRTLTVALAPSTLRISGTTTKSGSTHQVGGAHESTAITARLLAISMRAQVLTGNNIMIAGVIVSGSGSKHVLVRGIGPGLGGSVSSPLADPQLDMFRVVQSSWVGFAHNDNWGASADAAAIDQAAASISLGGLATGSADAAALLNIPAGVYTAQLSGAGAATGIGLIELYDVDDADASTCDFAGISVRGNVETGDRILIPGFIIDGDAPMRVLIRGIGPDLAPGVGNFLTNPILRVFDGGTQIAVNDDWSTGADANAVVEATSRVGLGQLGANSASSAIVIWLAPGVYTAQLSGVGGTTGVALVELYAVP